MKNNWKETWRHTYVEASETASHKMTKKSKHSAHHENAHPSAVLDKRNKTQTSLPQYILSVTWKSSIYHDAGAKHDESRVLLGGAQSISGPISTRAAASPHLHAGSPITAARSPPGMMLPHIGHSSQALQSSFPAAADPCHHTEARAGGPQQGPVLHRAAAHSTRTHPSCHFVHVYFCNCDTLWHWQIIHHCHSKSY